MSSTTVRNKIMTFLTTEYPTIKFLDMTLEYFELREVLEDANISCSDSWVGVQFVGDDESPITTGSKDKGTFRELGSVFLHVVEPAQLGVVNLILPKIESFRDTFRGTRVGSIVIEKVSPPNFDSGTLKFNDGWMSGSTNIQFYSDLNI